MTRLFTLIVLLAATVAPALGQRTVEESVPATVPVTAADPGAGSLEGVFAASVEDAQEGTFEQVGAEAEGGAPKQLSTAVEIALLLTLLSLLPAALMTLTSFTRIVIVLSFVRRALSINELPPNPILIGLALFLTMFLMAPIGEELYEESWTPYQNGEVGLDEAGDRAWDTVSGFLLANTRESELRLFHELSVGGVAYAAGGELDPEASATPDPDELPMRVVIPAFILSELKTAFQMGFLLFLPFLVIDLVVSSVLLSMGMFMLPPVMISTPIKVLVFVLVDGWRLVCESVVTSFAGVAG